jgi:predicted nucleic acid-binding protein
MSNRIFLDSSILVEYAKKSKMELLEELLRRTDVELCISETVLSEYTYYALIIEGQKAPRTLKERGDIPGILSEKSPKDFLQVFTVLPNINALIPEYLRLMTTYNLLPNDALILATCLLHGIRQVASHDESDFGPACRGEGLRLVQVPTDLLH